MQFVLSLSVGTLTLIFFAVLVVSWFVCFFLNSKSFPWFACLYGGLYFSACALGDKFTFNGGIAAVCIVLSAVALMQIFLLFGLELKRQVMLRKSKAAEKERALLFTLPDRENVYLRDRLNGTLNAERVQEERADAGVKLDYIRRIISKLKAAPLSMTDRLQVNEHSKSLTVCASKEGLTKGEMQAMNESFSALLKMAAKYGL